MTYTPYSYGSSDPSPISPEDAVKMQPGYYMKMGDRRRRRVKRNPSSRASSVCEGIILVSFLRLCHFPRDFAQSLLVLNSKREVVRGIYRSVFGDRTLCKYTGFVMTSHRRWITAVQAEQAACPGFLRA